MGIDRVGRTSFDLLCAMREDDSNEPCFVARVVQVYFRKGAPTPMSTDLRQALQQQRWSEAWRQTLEGKLVHQPRRAP